MKRAIRGDGTYESYTEHRMMVEYSIGYNELMEIPYKKYLDFTKIITLESKEEKKQQQKMEKKARSKR